jgi:hypothetical protein
MTGSLLRVRLALPLLAFVAILIVPAYAYPPPPACTDCDCFTSELTYDGGEFLGWREVHENGSTDAISVAFTGGAVNCGPDGRYVLYSGGRYRSYIDNEGNAECTQASGVRNAGLNTNSVHMTIVNTAKQLDGCGD